MGPCGGSRKRFLTYKLRRGRGVVACRYAAEDQRLQQEKSNPKAKSYKDDITFTAFCIDVGP
jgi:hypothetical protein